MALHTTEIHIKDYTHVDEIDVNGIVLTSVYNHNYYVNKRNNNDVILELCDDEDGFFYERINLSSMSFEFIGLYFGVRGIFNDGLEVIELHSADC